LELETPGANTPPGGRPQAHAGSFTLQLYTLSPGIPQLNAKLRALGIDETVVPMVNACPYAVPNSLVNGQETITLHAGHHNLAPGDHGFIAASQLSNGIVIYAQGAMPKTAIPRCVGTQPVIAWPAPTFIVIPNPGPATSRSNSPGRKRWTGSRLEPNLSRARRRTPFIPRENATDHRSPHFSCITSMQLRRSAYSCAICCM
jgi:hypothetical protein